MRGMRVRHDDFDILQIVPVISHCLRIRVSEPIFSMRFIEYDLLYTRRLSNLHNILIIWHIFDLRRRSAEYHYVKYFKTVSSIPLYSYAIWLIESRRRGPQEIRCDGAANNKHAQSSILGIRYNVPSPHPFSPYSERIIIQSQFGLCIGIR